MHELRPRVQHYAWGSREVIAGLTGRSGPSEQPEAELWFGAHELAPSELCDGNTLDRLVAADPDAVLGADIAEQFEGRLPFLLKVLAPVEALSIQAHPTAEQVAQASPGTYAGRWPKPEALYALSDFEIFAGTRAFAQTKAVVELLGVEALTAHVAAVESDVDPARALLARLLHLPADQQAPLADAVVEAARAHAADHPALDAVARIARQHPHDIGLVVLLSMRHRVLRPGEYAFVEAGVLHAYVHGVAVEIMSNSDNIVRAGLTRKPIDVDELLRICDLEHVIEPLPAAPESGWATYPVTTPYFQLRVARAQPDGLVVPDQGRPRVLLALHGDAEVSCGTARRALSPGEAVFLTASDPVATVTGDADLFLGGAGRSH